MAAGRRLAPRLYILVLGDDAVAVDGFLAAGIDRVHAEASEHDGQKHGEAEECGSQGRTLGLDFA